MTFKFVHAVKVKVDWFVEVVAGDSIHPVAATITLGNWSLFNEGAVKHN